MGGPVPCMGHASVTDAALALIAEGHAPGEVLARINVALGRDPADRRANSLIYSLCSAGGPRRQDRGTVSFTLGAAELHALSEAARRRGTYAKALARRLIEIAVRDGIVDAILDDDERTAA